LIKGHQKSLDVAAECLHYIEEDVYRPGHKEVVLFEMDLINTLHQQFEAGRRADNLDGAVQIA